MDKLKLEVLLSAIDKATGPLKAISKGSGEAARALRGAKDALKAIENQQGLIKSFKDADKAAAITANAFKGAQERVRLLQLQMVETPKQAQALCKALKDAQAESDTLKNRHVSLMEKQQRLFAQMKAGGIDITKLADHSRDLASRQIEAARATDKLREKLEAQNKVLSRMHAARATRDKSMAAAARLGGAGMAATAAGAAIGLPVAKSIKDYATFEDAMLGVARQVEGARDNNGKLTATYYEMGSAIKEMSERMPMASTEIARIVEAGARMGIQGKENLLTYTETTAVMAEAFKLPVDQIGDQIGKISDLYKIPIKDVKALGDTINWLDDNAKSNGGDIIDVMQRVAGSATMVNMNFKEAAALGSTFLSLGSSAEVASSATNAMIRELSIATMQTKRFKGGLDMLKLDAKAIQLGMSKNSTGTILKVLDAIKQLPQEKQLEAATRLFGKEFGDDASKLAQNLGEYRRQLELVNAESAKGSMQREADARKDTINARMLMAQNALSNVSSDLGQHLKPALVETLEKTLAITQAVRDWAKENPQLASGLMTTVKWASILLTVIGGGLVVLAGLGSALAMVKFGLAALNISGITGVIVAGIKLIGSAVLMSPLAPWLLLIGALAAALYVCWEPVKEVISTTITFWKSVFQDFHAWVQSIPEKFSAIGMDIMRGLADGILSGVQWVKDAIGWVADLMPGTMRKKLEVKSPSRVFAEIGGYTMAGLEQGILRAQDGPLGALAKATRNIVGAGAGMLIGGAALAMPALDTRGPLAMGGGAGGSSSMVVQITINPSPGMDEQALARAVAIELQRIESQRAARNRSRLTDRD